jgi:hypothetical protein
MKSSNIILLSAFASIVIWILAAMFTAKAKMKAVLKEHPELFDNKMHQGNHKTVQLEPFHTLVINGGGRIEIEESEGWSFDQILDDKNTMELRNDTLFMNVTGKGCNLNVNDLKNIVLKDSVWVEISDIETDSFNIFANHQTNLEIEKIKVKYIGIKSFDHSRIEYNGPHQANTQCELIIKNFSEVNIDDMDGMSLTIIKDPEAKFRAD